MRLAAKLMLVFLAVVMLQTAIGSYFSVRRAFERFERRHQEYARKLVDNMNEPLAEGWRKHGADGLDGAIERSGRLPDDLAMRWVWFEHHRLNDGSQIVVERQWVDSGRIITEVGQDRAPKRKLQTYYPIELKDAPEGGLEFTGSLDDVEQETRATILTSLISLGAMSFLAVGLVWIAGIRWVARPLDRLIEKTKRIGEGDFSDPLPVRGKDELSQLAGALNDMSMQLANQQERIVRETTDRLQTVEQLRHADRLKTVGRLAAGIAHELGTPLNVVSGRAGLIASGKLPPDEVAASAQTILSESDRITHIIRQLLDFARQNAARSENVHLGELLRQTVALIQPMADDQAVTIELPEVTNRTIAADLGQLQQVLTNILVNAIHAMPGGGQIVVNAGTTRAVHPDALSLSPGEPTANGATSRRDSPTSEEREYLTISIQDQGHGIPRENLADIFEPFYTTKDIGEGTGLGLSIAYGIIQDHGGWIDVDSEPGQGSCFTIYLPQESST